MPRALPCADAGLGSVKTSMVFLKAKTLKICRAVNAFLMKISHMDPFPGVAGRKGKGEAHEATCQWTCRARPSFGCT